MPRNASHILMNAIKLQKTEIQPHKILNKLTNARKCTANKF